jgi:hypothetical protein
VPAGSGVLTAVCRWKACLLLSCDMNYWWIGTVSTLAGAVAGAGLQAWRDHIIYKRQMSVRWDETLLRGLADYLTACDRSLRMFIRWREARTAKETNVSAADVDAAFETVHQKSHVITLLTGDRDNPIRLAARRMREPLLLMRDDVSSGKHIDDATFKKLELAHREARSNLVSAAQGALGVSHQTNDSRDLQGQTVDSSAHFTA